MGLQNSVLTLAPAVGMGGAAILVEESGARAGAVVLAVVWLVVGVVAIGARALRDLEPRSAPEAELVG
jgi:hypothetical protein